MEDLESLIRSFGDSARVRVVARVKDGDKEYPLHSVALGSPDPKAPVIGYFGGVHGLEKIGSEVVLAYMHTLFELLRWDRQFRDRLKYSRLVFMPLVNPVGVVNRTRCNGNGVDLMRNSPLDSDEPGGLFYRGHRRTAALPYYRGAVGSEMEIESKALLEVVEHELLTSHVAVAVDVHSGFGNKDQLWFPYAHSKQEFPYIAEAYAFKNLFDQTYPHHFYKIEPVSRNYTIHGDLWDYIFLENRKRPNHHFFLPFTLEMGSWTWLKKNPLQVFHKYGIFHPVAPHRMRRILRRHLNLFDFMHRAILSPEGWLHQSPHERERNHRLARELWYG